MTITYQKEFVKAIKGKTVAAVLPVSEDEEFPGLLFTDGTALIVQSDAEGNGPGFMVLQNKNGNEIGCAG